MKIIKEVTTEDIVVGCSNHDGVYAELKGDKYYCPLAREKRDICPYQKKEYYLADGVLAYQECKLRNGDDKK